MKVGWGIDVGVASLGFAVIELDAANRPARLIDGVALVYPAPTGGAERTRHKSIRTQYGRRADRAKALRAYLIRLLNLGPGFSDTPAGRSTERVPLRARGLESRLKAGDLARAVLHIAKNRGQRLTRGLKDDSKADPKQQKKSARERQSMADAANTTTDELAALGERLGLDGPAHPSQLLMHKAGKTGTTRLKKDREGIPVFTRPMMQAELDALLEAQQPYHEALTDAVCEQLREMVFEEAEPKKPSIGKCRYGEHDADGEIESRLPRGSDLFQRKRIYEEVNNLRLVSKRGHPDRPLTIEQRNHLASLLLDGKDLSAAKVRKALDLGQDALADITSLDISRKGRKTAGELKSHPLAAAMGKADALDRWRGFDEETRERIAELVRTEDEVEVLRAKLEALDLEPVTIQALSDARLPATYSTAGETATRKLLAELQADVIPNHDAESRAGLESLNPPPPRRDRLPYYGEILQGWCVGGDGDPGSRNEARLGRIPNPVVHAALNRLRKTANAYLRLYGKPAQICVELARDLNKSAEERENAEQENRKNRDANEKYIETLGADRYKLTPERLRRLRLHRMQDGECLYTGRHISREQLFDGSVTEIDHILPRADTSDDGISNLALVFTAANQYKRRRPPFTAFGNGYLDQDYEHILARAKKRGGGVYWRFKADAMERYKDPDEFQRRFLNDTRYIARMAARYLSCVCEDSTGVVSLNGRITSALRRKWGLHNIIRDIMVEEERLDAADAERPEDGETLEEIQERRKRADKIRWDHRHHLLDAIVAAYTTRSDVQRLQTLAARHRNDESASEILGQVRRADPDFRNVGICWRPEFREIAKAFLQERRSDSAAGEQSVTSVVVKADHDPRGQLHEATNYGLICEVPGERDKYVVRDHVSISEMKVEQIEKLGVRNNVIPAVERAKKKGARFWWGGHDPVSSLRNNLAPDLEKMRARLLELMQEAPPEALENAPTAGGRETKRAEWAKKQYIAETGRRRFTRVQIVSLRLLKGPLDRGKRPRQANRTRGNDRLVYFVNGEGDRDIEIVSILDANTNGFTERWRYEGGRLLFTLRKDDLVEMAADPKDPVSPRRIFRTVSFSGGKGPDLEFLPVEEARSPKEVPKHVRIRITKVKDFSERAPAMVLCDPTGRVRWRGPRLN